MSDTPFEIQAEIIKRLPVRSLIRFQSVSKAWKFHIDGSDFIACYKGQQHLLVSYHYYIVELEQKYVSIVDDDTFPQHKVFLSIHPLVKMLKHAKILAISNGLLCLHGDYREGCDGPFSGTARVVIWNPFIRKAVEVVVRHMASGTYSSTVLGFGVCRETNDAKIVKITLTDKENITTYDIPWKVDVFTLGTGAWRGLYGNLPRKSITFSSSINIVVDGVLYWLADDTITQEDRRRRYNMIISFDLTCLNFEEVKLPDSLTHKHPLDFSMYKLKESLVMLEHGVEANNRFTTIWKMEDGVPKSFTKLFTIGIDTLSALVKGFTKDDKPILERVKRYDGYFVSWLVYEPYSKHINNLGISGFSRPSFVYTYMETLLLLDHPDFIVYDNGKRYVSK
ncbi:hypothetical protein QVD17_30112 [Tagetes erecta]|uniref:F-box domain-containing protein n=1 Tax=Tagetes erecta TaxID=13708 RepID=A0AAD8K2X8_TARER|nr:hypothetical protein QVD17_30112 [Tagetes erecta]